MTQVRTPRSSSTRVLLVGRALSAALVIITIVAGVPAALLAIGAGPLPEPLASWGRLRDVLTSPDDGTLLLALLVLTAWVCWAALSVALALEVAGRLRGVPAPRLATLSLPQGVARGLVGAVAAAFLTVQPATASTVAFPVVVAGAEPAPGHGGVRSSSVPVAATSPVSATASHPRAQSERDDRGGATPAAGRPTESATVTLTHTVRPGETLWSLAERYLSDGTRYKEIADLNYGRPQPDGDALNDRHWIMPGWRLLVPAGDRGGTGSADDTGAATWVPEESPESPARHKVQAGETLWQIAEAELGDGHAWPAIYRESAGLEQPDGGRLRDPDQLRPGWDLALPDVEPSQPFTATTEAPTQPPSAPPTSPPDAPLPQPDAPASPTAVPPSQYPAPSPPVPSAPRTAPNPSAAPAGADQGAPTDDGLEEKSPWPVRTTTGVGTLLAAGILGTLGTRRRMQNLRRRPGQALPRISPDLARTERRLRATADPLSVHTVDLVLRSLARHHCQAGLPLPELRVARLTPDRFEIYLEQPAHLPHPWFTPDETPADLVWAILPDEAPILDEDALADIPAPYPALVTLGHDYEDAHFLVDLERLGLLDLAGPPEVSRGALAAIAVELATSTWADDVQVTVVGEFAGLDDTLKTGRIRYLPALADALDELTDRIRQDEAALAAAAVTDLQEARGLGRAPQTWTPDVLLVATPITAGQKERLADLAARRPRTAWAGVTLDSGLGRWTLHVTTPDGTAELDPIGLTLRPQLLDDETRGEVQHLVALADPDMPMDTTDWAEEARRDEPRLSDLAGLAEQAGPVKMTKGTEVDNEQPITQPGRRPATESAPVVRVLGSVQIEGARGQVEPSKRARLTELIAYLALHPGVGHVQIDEAIWPARRQEDNLNTRNTATSKARAWLGRSSSGEEFLPRHSAGSGYTLSEQVRTDWAAWQELVGDTPVTATTEDLDAALALVRGRPFEGVHPRRYAWADTLRQQMTTQIVDVAYELARRRLLAGRWQPAEAATAVGLLVEPAWEPLWRLRIMAAHEARNAPAVEEAVARMLAITEAVTGDLEPATMDLLSALESPGDHSTPGRAHVNT